MIRQRLAALKAPREETIASGGLKAWATEDVERNADWVLCLDVASSIPPERIPSLLLNLAGLAAKGLATQCNPRYVYERAR